MKILIRGLPGTLKCTVHKQKTTHIHLIICYNWDWNNIEPIWGGTLSLFTDEAKSCSLWAGI